MANVSSTSSFDKVEQDSARCMSPKSKKDLDQRASVTATKRYHKTPKAPKRASEILFYNYSHFKARCNADEGFLRLVDKEFRNQYASSPHQQIDLDGIIDKKAKAYDSIIASPVNAYRTNFSAYKKLYSERKVRKRDLISVTKET